MEEDDYFLGLLFYNYPLHCFVVFELKVGDFKPEYAGKLNFYINTVNSQVKGVDDKSAIGVTLCKKPDKTVMKYSLQGIYAPMGAAEYELTNALPKELQSELPTIEGMEQELEKEVEVVKSPLQEKLKRLKGLMAKNESEGVQWERSNDGIRYIFNELLSRLQQEIEANLQDIVPEFTKVEIGQRINSITNSHFTSADLVAKLAKESVYPLGLRLRMEGFRRAGTKAFGAFKDFYVKAHKVRYYIGKEQGRP